MTLDSCIGGVASELGISDKEAKEIADRLRAEQRRLLDAGGDLTRAEADLRAYAGREAERARINAALLRKQAALNVLARDRFDKHIDAQVARGVPLEEAILSFLYGGPYSRDSVARRRKSLEGQWVKGLLAKAYKAVPSLDYHLNHPKESAEFFDNTVREMAELKPDGAPGKTGDRDARAFAEILANQREAGRLEANLVGANIGKLEGSAGPQAHDEIKLLKAKREPWKGAIVELLDLPRSFGEGTSRAEALDILNEVYSNIVTGRDRAVSAAEKGERTGPANLARSLEKHRVLHFKDADAYLAYNKQFGRGNVVTGILDEMSMLARRVSLMQKLGPNPEVMLTSVLAERARKEGLNVEGREKEVRTLIEKLKLGDTSIGKAYTVVSGNVDIPVSVSQARIWANVRAVITMAKLGASLTSQFADLATVGATLRNQGDGYLEAYSKAVAGFVTGGGPGAKERGLLLGVGADSVVGDIHRRFDVENGLRGKMADSTASFFKLSGVRWWSERNEVALANMTSANMALRGGKTFDQLDERFAHGLSLNGITGERWNIAQLAVREEGGGRYLMPEAIGGLPDEAFDALVKPQLAGDPRTGEALAARRAELAARERRELELDVRSYIAEEVESGVIKGDDRTKAVVTQGTRPGSSVGELWRFFGQFKSFPIAYYQRSLRRQTRGFPGADPSLSGIRGGLQGVRRNFPAIATLIATATVYGYASTVAKDLIKNRTPKAWNRPATWLAALAQGGGLGLYGDFLFSQVSRTGGGPLSNASGPFAGEADTLLALGLKARNRLFHPLEKPKGDDAKAADFIRFGLSNTPYLNLFYIRPALDLAILNSLEEWSTPGAFKRRARALKEQFGQSPILTPLNPLGSGPIRR